MDSRTRSFLLAPAPLSDPAMTVDPIIALAVQPGVAGGFLATTRAGRELVGRVLLAAPGALRLLLAADEPSLLAALGTDSPMMVSAAGTPAEIACAAGVLTAKVGAEVLRWDPLFGAPLARGFRPPPRTHTLTGPAPVFGPVVDGNQVTGWLAAFGLGADDAVFGGGEAFAGPDLRGRVRHCVNVEAHGAAGLDLSYLTVPLVWSDGGWGVWAHTGAPVRIDVAATHVQAVALDVPGTVLDLLLYGGPAREILAAHHAVTGLPGQLPDWALGVWTSRCSYLSAEEVEQVLDRYAEAACPVDVVHVDAWQVGNVVADLTTAWEVDRERWPVGWSKALVDRGVRLSLWHNPFLRVGTAAGDEAVAAGLVLRDDAGQPLATNDMPDRLVLDFTHEGARQWWRHQVETLVSGEGASSFKPDFAEEVPPTARCSDGRTGWQIRNEYALLYQRESAAALRAATGESAVAMFCRSGTAGAQRYPCHWVGDTPSTWEGMAAALRACLSLSLSGFGFVTSDVGGFHAGDDIAQAGKAFAANDPSQFAANVDPELFLRWSQWGALSPLLRFHGAGRREPWAYPGIYGQQAIEACRLRERLRPYLAVVSAEASTDGTPMMRPMALAYPGDRAARDAALQYLLGPDLLVAPVLQPGGDVRVFVPEGRWRGLAGAPDLTGPGWFALQLDLAQVPAWVRSGSSLEELT